MYKKIIILITIFTVLITPVYALSSDKKEVVTLSNCTDSTSARFIYNKNEIKVKFIGIDVVNSLNNSVDIDSKTIDEFICDTLKNAKKIELELEKEIEEKDKYDRYNAWVFVDDVLLQDTLLKKGYAKTYYLYENYKYYDTLKQSEQEAKDEKIGIWNVKQEETKEEVKSTDKDEGIFSSLMNFINKVFEKILQFIDDLIKNVFN